MSDSTTGTAGPSPLVVGAIGVIVGASIIVGGVWLGILAAGDEAPIRVKNGSIDLELVYKGKKWKEDGDKKHWKPKDGSRNSDGYTVYITPSNAANCPGGVNPSGTTIRFEYADGTGTYVEVKSQNKKTKINSDKDLVRSADEMTISYGATGYISSVRVDGNEVCKFNEKDPKLNIVLLDQ